MNTNYVQEETRTNYVQKGTSNYNFTLCHTYQRPSNKNKMPLGVDIQKLIVELKNKQNEALNVLDIGTGNGDFIKEHHDPSSVCVYGISLDDE